MWEGNLARNSLKCSQLGEDACQRRHIPHTIYATMVHLASSLYFHELVPPWHLLTRTSASSTSKSPRFFHLAPDSFNSIWTSSAGIVEILKVSGIVRTDQLQGLGPQIAGVEFPVLCLWKEIRPTAQICVQFCTWDPGSRCTGAPMFISVYLITVGIPLLTWTPAFFRQKTVVHLALLKWHI